MVQHCRLYLEAPRKQMFALCSPGPWYWLCLVGMHRAQRSSHASLLCRARECAAVASAVSRALTLLHRGRRDLCAGQDACLAEQRTVLLCRSLGRDSLHTRQMVPHSPAVIRGWGAGRSQGASRVLGARRSPKGTAGGSAPLPCAQLPPYLAPTGHSLSSHPDCGTAWSPGSSQPGRRKDELIV